jgi:hypothetical protein
MDQGLLVAPFALLLVIFALFDGRIVLGVWSFTVLAMPTLRSRFGPVSVYWCDVAALVACFICLRWPPRIASQRMTKWYLALGVAHCIGGVTSLVRYEAILEPGYEALRYAIAFLPLVLLPRVAEDDETMAWFWRGVLVAALWMAVLALIQSFWRDIALQLETFMYGARSQGSVSLAYRERALMESTQLRVHGMYGVSTCFAGAATMTGTLLVFYMSRVRAGLLTRVGLLGSAIAMLLTFSRHGLLAWGALLIPSFVRKPGRGAILPVLLLASVSVLGARQFWAERINRGGVSEDENLSARLVDRPLELLDRISEEPLILVAGVGLGTDHMNRADEDGPSRVGFVSNGFALYLFYLGISGLVVVVGLLATTLHAAWRLDGDVRAAAIGGLGATVVIIASDNYGFLHTSFPFMWSVLVALIHAYADSEELSVASDESAEAALIAH